MLKTMLLDPALPEPDTLSSDPTLELSFIIRRLRQIEGWLPSLHHSLRSCPLPALGKVS